MHYVSTVLGIRDPIHKQKIALKAMDVVLFGPPRGEYKHNENNAFLYAALISAMCTCCVRNIVCVGGFAVLNQHYP